MEFFVPMKEIPNTTHQQKKVTVAKNGKPVFYEPAELKAAREKLTAHLAKFVPETKFKKLVILQVKWLYPKEKHENGSYKTTRPDLDNMMKLLQDCMTDLGFWDDDRLIAGLHVEKFWSEVPGIYIKIEGA